MIDFSYRNWCKDSFYGPEQDIDLSGYIFPYGVNFSHSTFHKDVNFEGAEFYSSKARVEELYSHKPQKNIRNEKVIEEAKEITKEETQKDLKPRHLCADFFNVTFKKNANFKNVIFNKTQYTSNNKPKHIKDDKENTNRIWLDFTFKPQSTVQIESDYTKGHIKKGIYDFPDTSPVSWVTFEKAQFQKADFSKTNFHTIAGFYNTTFEEAVFFNDCKFHSKTYLGAHFGSDLHLSNTKFLKHAPDIGAIDIKGAICFGNNTTSEIENNFWPYYNSGVLAKIPYFIWSIVCIIIAILCAIIFIIGTPCSKLLYLFVKEDLKNIVHYKYIIRAYIRYDKAEHHYKLWEELIAKYSIHKAASFTKLKTRARSFQDNISFLMHVCFRPLTASFWYCLISDYGRSIFRPIASFAIMLLVFSFLSACNKHTNQNITYNETININYPEKKGCLPDKAKPKVDKENTSIKNIKNIYNTTDNRSINQWLFMSILSPNSPSSTCQKKETIKLKWDKLIEEENDIYCISDTPKDIFKTVYYTSLEETCFSEKNDNNDNNNISEEEHKSTKRDCTINCVK